MAFAPDTENNTGRVAGEFRTREFDTFFQFSTVMDEADQFFGPEFNRKVWVKDGWRFAKVMKTRVRVVVDEAPNRTPVTETWETKQFRTWE